MNEHELQRQAKHRLAILRHVEEVSGNVAATCRYYGISRQRFYRWQRRYEELGLAGLRDRSKRPHHCPNATSDEVIGKVIHLRQHYHFGPLKISMYLKRYHDVEISQSGVWRILKRLDMNRLPSISATSRSSGAGNATRNNSPGIASRWTSSSSNPCKEPARPRYYQFTAIDDCTRLRVLRIYDRNNQNTAIQFLDYVCQKLPFRIDVIQTDNGSEFGSQFHWHVLDRGIRHVYIRPATPRLNGKVERSHRIDAEEFYRLLDGQVIDDARVFNEVSPNGRPTTTTTDHTEPSAAKPPTNGYVLRHNQQGPTRNGSPSVAHRRGHVVCAARMAALLLAALPRRELLDGLRDMELDVLRAVG